MFQKTGFTIILIIATGLSSVLAQYDYPGTETKGRKNRAARNINSKIFFGGTIGLSLRDQTAYVEVSPLIGYRITPRLWTGGGPKYTYLKHTQDLQTHDYGMKLFSSFSILDNINEVINISLKSVFIHAETEILHIKPLYYQILPNKTYYPFYGDRTWYNITLVGGGIRFPMGDNTGVSIMALWGVTPATELRYSNPDIRVSIYF